MNRKLLLIDDDKELAMLLRDFVQRHGFDLVWADRPSVGFGFLDEGKVRPELVLLDVMLPEMDGFEVCRLLRKARNQVPVIMLTARGDDPDCIRGLQIGADDYLAKPFNPLELIARIEAVLRRARLKDASNGLDQGNRTLSLDGEDIPLTPSEYRLIEAMTASPGRVFSRDQLLDLLDAGGGESFDRAIDIHVSRLRGKLEEDARNPRHLITVRGLGYRFEW
ncbi:MAG TPA: DNA-binding response regulator [Cyanobacteria bacterium UBA8530]|nr:DNA-binding response regulator [Cyanobacteria bacterium UBA8530]